MNVLILGARGMLGRQLADVFADLGPICWDRGELDITNEAMVREKVVAGRPDVIINAAAYTDVDGAEGYRDEAFAVNKRGIGSVASAAKDIGATLVHYSTDYVFPGTREEGYAEDDPPGPAVNTYGESKLAGERVLKEIAPEFYLLRTAWLYGLGGKNFVDTMLRLGQERRELKIVDDQHGSPTYAKDVARATREILGGDFEPGIYHVVNAGTATWYEFAQEIFRQANVKVAVESTASDEYPLPAKRPEYSVLRLTRGPRLRPWQEALGEYLSTKVSS